MTRIARTFASSLAAFLVAGAVATPVAHAWSSEDVAHPVVAPAKLQKKNGVTVVLFNRSGFYRDIKVAGQTYTMMPHHALSVTAPAGTQVVAAGAGFSNREGTVLVTIYPELKNATVYIN